MTVLNVPYLIELFSFPFRIFYPTSLPPPHFLSFPPSSQLSPPHSLLPNLSSPIFLLSSLPRSNVSLDLLSQEYRGQRSAESLASFITDQLKENVKVFESLQEVEDAEKDKSAIIGYLEKADSANYAIFQRMARSLRDECNFYAVFG